MREIKFRVPHYNRDTGKFDHFSYWGRGIIGSEFCSPSMTNFTNPKEDEQFTGLKDKNGVEIYHNDLIKDQFGFMKRVESYFSEFILMDHDVSYKLMDYIKMVVPGIASNLEVIGNVHQNPELLK